MTFADLKLPYSYGHGIWTQSAQVTNDNWAWAEDMLTTAAQSWLSDEENQNKAGGYHVFRDETNKVLTLDLMHGA